MNMEYEIKIPDSYIELFRELIGKKFGIHIPKEKDYLLHSKLGKLLKTSKYNGVGDLYSSVKSGDEESIEDLIGHITTTFTFFFREKMHLKILRNDIILRKISRPVIWCAASSSGEEVYSIIIELLEHGIEDFLVVATDLNAHVLRDCKAGIYHPDRLKEATPQIKAKYFDHESSGEREFFKVKSFLKKNLVLKKINLIDKIRFERRFDYIFCRNVLIYLDRENQRRVVDTLLDNLDELGYLFVGHAESLLTMNNKLETVFASVYNKKR
jgi:chemotaxis protein methyltransferase CheR